MRVILPLAGALALGAVVTSASGAPADAGGARAMLGVPRLGGHQQRVVGAQGGLVWSLGDDGLWIGRNPRSLRPVRTVAPADGGRVLDGAVGRDVLVSVLDQGGGRALVGLHPRTGEVVWTTGSGLDLVDVVAAGGRVVAVDRRTWLAFRVDEGAMVPLVPIRDGAPLQIDVRAAAVADDGAVLLVSGLSVLLVDREDRVRWEAEVHLTGLPAFSASGREVALPVEDHVELRDVDSGEIVERWDAPRPPLTVAVSADGRELVWSDPWRTFRARRGKNVVELDRPTVAAVWEGRVAYLAPSEGDAPVKWRGAPPGGAATDAPWVPLRCVTDTTGAVAAASGPTGVVRWEVGRSGRAAGDRLPVPVPFGADLALSPDGAEVWVGPTSQPAQRWVRTWTAGSPAAFAAGRWWTADTALRSRDAAGGSWASPETLAPSLHLWMSGSGRTAVLATDGGYAWFDAETGAQRPLALPPGAIDPDGEVLAEDDQLVVWDAERAFVVTERGRRRFDLGDARPLALRGDWLAVARGRRVELWSVAAGAPVRVLGEAASHVSCAGFSGDGTSLVSGSYDGTLRMWDVPPPAPPSAPPARVAATPREVPGAAVARTLPFPREAATSLVVADGLAWVVGERGTAVGFAPDTGEAVWRWDRPARAVGGGASLIVADDLGVHGVGPDGARAWTAASSFVPREVHAAGDALVAVRDDETAVVVRGRTAVDVPRRGGTVWPVAGDVLVEDWAAPSLGAPIVALSDDGALAAVAVGPGRIGVQARAGGARFEVALRGARVRWAAFSPDRGRLAVAGDVEVAVIDVATRRIVARLATPRPWSRVAWADDRTLLGIDGAGLEPIRWSVGAPAAEPSPYGVRPGAVRSCAVSPDGAAVVVGDDAGAWWFSAEDGALLGVVPGRGGVFGPEGRLVTMDGADLAAYDAPDRQAWRLRVDPASVAVVGEHVAIDNAWFTLAGRSAAPAIEGRLLATSADGGTAVVRAGKALRVVRADGAVVPVEPAPCDDADGRCDRAVSATAQATWVRPPWTSPTVRVVDLGGTGGATVIPLGLYGGGARPQLLVGDELVVSRGTTLERWSTRTSARTAVIELGARASCVAASADGGTLVVADDDGELIVFRR